MLTEAGLHPKRALGQNFVADANTVRRIARIAGVGTGDHVVEIGAGLGSLTLALAESGVSVDAIERDGALIPLLRNEVSTRGLGNVQIHHGDALSLDWGSFVRPGSVVVANLPYNVGTAMVMRVLEEVPEVRRLVVMLQREVVDRIVAEPRSKSYGILSVGVSYYANAYRRAIVGPSVFYPRPDVESAVVEIVRHEDQPSDVTHGEIFALVRKGFGQRRKMLRSVFGDRINAEMYRDALVEPTARAEELSLQNWIALARVVQWDHDGI